MGDITTFPIFGLTRSNGLIWREDSEISDGNSNSRKGSPEKRNARTAVTVHALQEPSKTPRSYCQCDISLSQAQAFFGTLYNLDDLMAANALQRLNRHVERKFKCSLRFQ